MKNRITLLCLLIVACLLPFSAYASADPCEVDMHVSMNGDPLYTNGTYTVHGGEQIVVSAGAWAGIDRIGYYLSQEGGEKTETIDVYDDFASFTLPEYPANTRVGLFIEAIASNDDGQADVPTKTGWHYYELEYRDRPQVSMRIELGDTVLHHDDCCCVKPGDTIDVTASSDAGIERIGYRFVINGEETDLIDVYEDTVQITVPEVPEYSYAILRIEAIAKNDDGTENTVTKTGWYRIILCY